MEKQHHVCVYLGDELAKYNFGNDHPFGPERLEAFWMELKEKKLDEQVEIISPRQANQDQIERFHSHEYVERVKSQSLSGQGYLDSGDTPAFTGVYEATSFVVGSSVDAVDQVMKGHHRRAFVPIAGLHHARRDSASGFCVFNDCGVVIETLRKEYQLTRIVYVDIDAHHGDGVFYAFEDDPCLFIVDIHEDGRFLFPGTGHHDETGKAGAAGSKLNFCLQPSADDEAFFHAWQQAEQFIHDIKPEFIILQCGADSLAGDPITHLHLSEQVHTQTAESLCRLADTYCEGRIIGLGGGGYNHSNIAKAWTGVVKSFVDAPFRKS